MILTVWTVEEKQILRWFVYVLIWEQDRVYCGTLTAAYNLLYVKFTYIGEVLLFFVEDNTEGKICSKK